MPTPLMECCALGRRHPDGKGFLLRDVSLSIDAGQRVAIVGPSGAGKTLLLRALAMLDPIECGQILWNGEVVAAPAVPRFRSQVVYLHQRPALFDDTVESNLRVPFYLAIHAGKTFDRDWIVERLQRLGRGADFLGQQAKALSGGESQLVAVLRAVQLRPEVLLFDEATASLDSGTSEAVEQLAGEWLRAAPNRALVWVSHNREQAHRMTDEIVYMAGGRLVLPDCREAATSPLCG